MVTTSRSAASTQVRGSDTAPSGAQFFYAENKRLFNELQTWIRDKAVDVVVKSYADKGIKLSRHQVHLSPPVPYKKNDIREGDNASEMELPLPTAKVDGESIALKIGFYVPELAQQHSGGYGRSHHHGRRRPYDTSSIELNFVLNESPASDWHGPKKVARSVDMTQVIQSRVFEEKHAVIVTSSPADGGEYLLPYLVNARGELKKVPGSLGPY